MAGLLVFKDSIEGNSPVEPKTPDSKSHEDVFDVEDLFRGY